MKTQILTVKEAELAGKLLAAGELVAIPTETVYGLGANGLDSEAMSKIYEAKGRPSDNPLILHVPDRASINGLVEKVSDLEEQLMAAFWPGPLTITFPKSARVPLRATGGLGRVALRCPDHDVCRAILRAAGVPIAAPSANISGRPSPTTANAVARDMQGKIAAIVDAGPCSIGVESTVVECSEDSITILRPGGITRDMLLTICDKVSYDKALANAKEAPKAPGMKYTHYAPIAEMTTFIGGYLFATMETFIMKHGYDKTYGFFVSEELAHNLRVIEKTRNLKAVIYTFGKRGDLLSQAHHLYEGLLYFNEHKVDYILAEGCPKEGLGVAIMNRMEKASAHRIIDTNKIG